MKGSCNDRRSDLSISQEFQKNQGQNAVTICQFSAGGRRQADERMWEELEAPTRGAYLGKCFRFLMPRAGVLM